MISGSLCRGQLLFCGTQACHKIVDSLLALLMLVFASQCSLLAVFDLVVQLSLDRLKLGLQGLCLCMQSTSAVGVGLLAFVDHGLKACIQTIQATSFISERLVVFNQASLDALPKVFLSLEVC